ncbi:MAG TPA: hypothetical protein VHW74_06870 [Mycobacteriales bacterium]|nr:hypothetical protein [Mycobacteriales bacterium]
MIARRATKRTVAAGALALALPVLTGCGMEAKDETSKEHTEIQAASNHIGAIKIRNAFLTTVPPTSTDSVTPGTTYLVVTLVNDGKTADFLTGVTTSLGAATLSGAVTLPPGFVREVSDPLIDPGAATVVVSGPAPTVGTTAQAAFTFATAGTTGEIDLPVVDSGETLTPDQVIPTTQATVATPIV